jgi:biotin operon repressor
MVRTAEIRNDKLKFIIALRRECQSGWKMSRTLKVSSSAVAKTIKHS